MTDWHSWLAHTWSVLMEIFFLDNICLQIFSQSNLNSLKHCGNTLFRSYISNGVYEINKQILSWSLFIEFINIYLFILLNIIYTLGHFYFKLKTLCAIYCWSSRTAIKTCYSLFESVRNIYCIVWIFFVQVVQLKARLWLVEINKWMSHFNMAQHMIMSHPFVGLDQSEKSF